MDITLNDHEITEAVSDYISTLGVSLEGKDVVVKMTAGRKENGYSASVSITPNGVAPSTQVEDTADVVDIKPTAEEPEPTQPAATADIF